MQRWLKFAKYLCRQGWEPMVFTPENPSFAIKDESLMVDVPSSVEVIRFPIWEPYHLFFGLQKLFGKKQNTQSDFVTVGKKSFFQRITSWIRGNFFIPDARVFWVRPSVKMIGDLIASNQIKKIITTGPPHSIHLIGLKLKRKYPNLKWVADFRDPWSEWDLLDTLSLTSLARARHVKLENQVLTTADRVITIAPYHVDRLKELSRRSVDLITNGFDADDFADIKRTTNSKFTIRHIGIVDELRDPRPALEAIKEIGAQRPDILPLIQVEFIGNVNRSFQNYVSADPVLPKVVSFRQQVPHDELLKVYGQTDLQLLVLAHTAIAPGNLPGKLFEYLASGNQILGIGPPDGDAAQVITKTNAGIILHREDAYGIQKSLLSYFETWRDRKDMPKRDVTEYSRERLTEKLIAILESLD